MYEFIRIQYELGYFSVEEVNGFVPFWLTAEEASKIIEEDK